MNNHPRSFDDLVAAQPTMDQLHQKGREAIAPLLKQLDEIKRMEQGYKGAQYYHALEENGEGYARWQEKMNTAEKEYQRLWEQIQEQYKEITDEPYTGDHREPGPKQRDSIDELFDDTGSVSPEAIDESIRKHWIAAKSAIGLDREMIIEHGAATGILRHGVKSPEEFIQEMGGFQTELLNQDAHTHATLPPDQIQERAKAFDDVYGFHRYALGFGLAAFEEGRYAIAGQAIGLSRSIAVLPRYEEGRLANRLRDATLAARAQFSEGLSKYQRR